MLLTNEAGLRRRNPRWTFVDNSLRELDPGHINSFACLSLPGNTYIQVLRGFNGWHLEWRITGETVDSYVHLRASYPGASPKQFELKKHDFVSEGQYRDLLELDDVIDAFRCFHQGGPPPAWLDWRELDV